MATIPSAHGRTLRGAGASARALAARAGARPAAAPLAAPPAAPAGAPQLWQNFAPGVSGVSQDAHVTPSSAAPHSEQNFPLDVAPHDGQVTPGLEALDMRRR